MKLKALSTAMILATVPMTGAFAAAMDRSGQSMAAFLQPGNYFEAGISVLDPSVSGKEAGETPTRRDIGDMAGDYYFPSAALKLQPTKNFSFGILYDQPFGAEAEYTGNNAFVSDASNTILPQPVLDGLIQSKVETAIAQGSKDISDALTGQNTPLQKFSDLTDTQIITAGVANQLISAGLAPTDPAFGSTLQTQVQNLIAASGGTETAKGIILEGAKQAGNQQVDDVLATAPLGTGNTKVEVDTQSLSFVFGFQPNENWNFYAGPVYQTIKGNLSLRGQAYSIFNGYDATIKETGDIGWLAGFAYQIPEIALKASLTYRSEIDHDVKAKENLSAANALGLIDVNPTDITEAHGNTRITTPQSVNLDFQTGIMANTVAFANVRWVEWSKFAIRPYQFGLVSEAVGKLDAVNRPTGFDLVAYDEDQISATVGVGRKLNDQWAGNVSVGWDSGAGNPVSTLGPTEGYWNVGLGVQYSPAANYFIAGGVKYFMLGDAKSQTAAQYGENNRIVGDFQDNDAWAYGLKIGYRF